MSDGGPSTDAIAAELDAAGTPYTVIDLTQAGRPVIDAGFLADTVDGRPRAKFQAVVLPNDNPFPAGSAEMAALAAYEKTFGDPAGRRLHLRPPGGRAWTTRPRRLLRQLDGARAAVTAAGQAGPFGYLDGAVPFEDNAPAVRRELRLPVEARAGADFTSYVDAADPRLQPTRGSLVGEYRHDGRRELVVTFVYNQYQQQFRLLARGIVDWLTQGVHLGASRNYFAVHVDDVFAADDRWDSDAQLHARRRRLRRPRQRRHPTRSG